MVKTRTSTGAAVSKVATGTYTGDGAATKAITGVGFQPLSVIVYRNIDLLRTPGYKITQDGVFSVFWSPNLYLYRVDMIISLDADGFTVGDGTPFTNVFNITGAVYTYICFA